MPATGVWARSELGTAGGDLGPGTARASECVAAGDSGAGAAPAPEAPCVLHLFAGPPLAPFGIAVGAAALGLRAEEVDILQGAHHDLACPELAADLQARAESGDFAVILAGVCCETFSVAAAPGGGYRGRADDEILGLPSLDADGAAKVDEANALVRHTVLVCLSAWRAGAHFAIENPSDRGDADGPARWSARAGHPSLFLMPEMQALRATTGAEFVHTTHCAFAGHRAGHAELPQKWTSFLASPRLAAALRPRLGSPCRAIHTSHPRAWGGGRAKAAAAYPPGLNAALLAAFAEVVASDRPEAVLALPPLGDQIKHGLRLHPAARRAIAESQAAPLRFADHRRLTPMPPSQRWAAPMPTQPLVLPAADRGPQPDELVDASGEDDERESSRPASCPRPARPDVGRHPFPGGPPRPIAWEALWIAFPGDEGRRRAVEEHRRFMEEATPYYVALAKGEPPPPAPKRCVLLTEWKHVWARGWIVDCRDPDDCVPVRRSTADTVFHGERQIRRQAVVQAARELGWDEIDADIVRQAGGGGLELTSDCPRVTILEVCHKGAASNFAIADKAILSDVEAGWATGPFVRCPPFEPHRDLPRNIVFQTRSRVKEGTNELEDWEKPRVTINMSSEAAEEGEPLTSVNAGATASDVTLQLPSEQDDAQASAICDAAGDGDVVRAAGYSVDWVSAYCYTQIQRGDWWKQGFLWIVIRNGVIVVGHFYSSRLTFGGRAGPNRFQRLALLVRARARAQQHAFDATVEFPEGVNTFVAKRRALQRAGVLPPGDEQLSPSYLQQFIDDAKGVGLTCRVPVPAELRAIPVNAGALQGIGGLLAPDDCHAAVHCRICIANGRFFGFEEAETKTACGDDMISLGLKVSIRSDRLLCPENKREVLIKQSQAFSNLARLGGGLDQDKVERYAGRVVNLSQIYPDFAIAVYPAYAVAYARRRAGRAHSGSRFGRVGSVHLRRGGDLAQQFLALTGLVEDTLQSNTGCPLIPAAEFGAVTSPGSLTVATDASGDDGFGGFAFAAESPDVVGILSEAWPADIAAALAHSAMPRKQRDAVPPAPLLAMPAAELFGAWAVAAAARSESTDILTGETRVFSTGVQRIFAIGDCAPAAIVVQKAGVHGPQMRELAHAMRQPASRWLGAHVRRAYNTDPDALSHPERVDAVIAAAAAAGYRVHRLWTPAECWRALRLAIEAARQREEERRLHAGPRTAGRPRPPSRR